MADLGIVKSGEVPQLQVVPDRVALARYGMTLGDFQHVFQTAVGGRPVDEFWEGERRFDVVLRLPRYRARRRGEAAQAAGGGARAA